MGRRVKSIVALLVVLGLLYWQQDQISYATETEEITEPGDLEEEKPEENPEEKPEEPQVKMFEAEIPGPDGENGYYRSWPAVKIRHVGEAGMTHCRLVNSEGQAIEQALDEKGEEAAFGQEQFRAGKNELKVWMTDEEGEPVEEYVLEHSFWIDMTGPVIDLSVPQGMDAWYGEEVPLSVSAKDGQQGSRTAEISCSVQGQVVARTDREKAVFQIRQFSEGGAPVKVSVKAVDYAGNVTWRECGLFIDGKAPEAVIEGAEDYTISSQPVEIRLQAREENVLAGAAGKVIHETPDGAVREQEIQGWTDAAGGREALTILEEDGSYQVSMELRDAAGHMASEARNLIIDRTNPIIQYVDALDGTYQKSFCLDNKKGDLIQDFTTYTYTVSLDGRLYPLGETVNREGLHFLEVKAVDAAGNVGTASAEFVVDHTAPKVIFRNLEEGKVYEEQQTFQVTLEDQKDEIREIRINGIRQKTSTHSKIYQYTVEDERDYEVTVKASDRAGNETTERITFEVAGKETLVEQILNPIKKTLGLHENKNERAEDKEKQEAKEENPNSWTIVLVASLGIAVAGGSGWMVWRRILKP